MQTFDVFNGDADGICSLLQLRQAMPCQSQLITGIKRDINLLKKVSAQTGDQVNVLDVSLDKNRIELVSLLAQGVDVLYIDHHFCGELPESEHLSPVIDTQPNTCTSLLMYQYLKKELTQQISPLWAITGTFGDNLNQSAFTLASETALKDSEIARLKSLGIYINYNGYGASVSDLHFAPDELFKLLLPYHKPLDFINDSSSVYASLKSGYDEDNAHVQDIKAEFETDKTALFILPNAAWARRISGVYSNELVNQYPDRAHAVLTENDQDGYLISVRAPLNNKTGADDLCRQFESGGGRKAAAGINHLPKADLERFMERFSVQFVSKT
ncbi:DHH family phosphoesterase [sulfur-oxidizing endosymbiont of Gigantopelta aegis]|uniref:DHH family phosphoesterase n=1 Tax=sulfur-oxidizing endosymbiont of Gigantopelta aegis TaxID=2794934 RepID=UPI0018DC543E|nr:DHH family phosphoesterase [sulfur-oxidizing endosymbiont of Gigantopelta aegis]